MAWHGVTEFVALIIMAGALPAAVCSGLLLRYARGSKIRRALGWSLWCVWSLGLWFICLPATTRTNEPSGEGIVIIFLLTYGPLVGAVWLVVQQILGTMRMHAARGFEVVEARKTRRIACNVEEHTRPAHARDERALPKTSQNFPF